MGGTNENLINGLRLHVNKGDVHIHDDGSKKKFERDVTEFKEEVETALEQLDNKDGVYKITAECGNDLCLMKDGRTFSMFLLDDKSVKTRLKEFIRGC